MTPKEEFRRQVFGTFYDLLRDVMPVGSEKIQGLRNASLRLCEAVENLAEERAKVVCGQLAIQIREIRELLEGKTIAPVDQAPQLPQSPDGAPQE